MLGWLKVGKEVGDAAGGVLGAVFEGIDKLHTSDEEKATAKRQLEELMQQPMLWQAVQNRIEAQHRTVFVAGWRPFIGWICGAAIAWRYLIHPLLTWALKAAAPDIEPPPVLEFNDLMAILVAMLGVAGYRTVEKIKGVAK